ADAHAAVRQHAVALATGRVEKPSMLRSAVICAADDADIRVRFQAALAAHRFDATSVADILTSILLRDGGDAWLQSAALSSAANCSVELLSRITTDPRFSEKPYLRDLLVRLAAMIGGKADGAEITGVFKLFAYGPTEASWKTGVIEGLGQGLRNT